MAKENTSLMAYAGQITDAVEKKINTMLESNRLDLPADYSVSNALKAMQLAIMQTEDRNKQPALSVCTQESIVETMFSMAIQGLNPDKKQCYPIVYGSKLTLFRSYFGSIAVAKRVDPSIMDINASVVYKGDTIKSHKVNGNLVIDLHEQDILQANKDNIIGAYCTVVYNDGRAISEYRTFDQIKQAWKQSLRKPIDEKGNIKEDSTHAKFTEDMCMRTVINRVCKRIINESSDASILAQYAKKTQQDMDVAEAEELIAVDANTGELIDIDDEIEEVEVIETTASEDGKPKTSEDDSEPIQMELT